ncbi:hypothetical protein RvY_04288 [Ramazzottius varieornatus]|uniref:Uncharacterized protein n=1 Tax=Ramazzottius varieornatus TaxID=947166 RepID=A0A1D1UUP6_RAMVA|nr:hypothetical protein RvY_04288 [Ramazzottius varieornatus]
MMCGTPLVFLLVGFSWAGSPFFDNSNFGNFQPMNFPKFQFSGMNAFSNLQTQGQTQGQSAATGEGTADSGQLTSVQNSDMKTNDAGTLSTGGSLGQCQGTNCNINGASQVGTQGAFQSQGSLGSQKLFNGQGGFNSGGFPSFGMFGGSDNTGLQSQFQSQFQNSGAAVGSGQVAAGTVNSAQNTNAITNKEGTRVLSTNIGSGQGTNLGLSGAVQAQGQGQTAGQISGIKSTNTKTGVMNGQGADFEQNSANQGINRQSQSQSQGTGAATGQANVVEGSAQNLLSSDVNTNNGGTSVSSNAANTASGKGLRVSGAVSAGGGSQSQVQTNSLQEMLAGLGRRPQVQARNNYPAPVPVTSVLPAPKAPGY